MAERFMRRSRRYLVSPLTVVLVMMLVAVAPDQAYGPQAAQAGQTAPAQGAPGQAGPGQPIKLPARALQSAGRHGSDRVGDLAAALQPDQHRHRSRRPHLGGRRRPLPLPSRPSTRRRPHRRAPGHRWRRQGRQLAHLRAGAGAGCAPRRLGHRQQDRRGAAAGPHRLYRRRSQPEVRSGGGQARSAADRVPGHQPRPLAALGDGRARRQVDLQFRQHGGNVHRQVRQDLPDLRLLSSGSGRALQVPAQPGGVSPASRATTGTSTWAGSRCG